jgi:hypothetical protein
MNQTVLADSVRPIFDAGSSISSSRTTRSTPRALEPTPGHTPGHVSVHVRSRGEEAVITGDLVHHPAQFARPHWGAAPDWDRALADRTRRAFMERYADTPVLVIGTHFAGRPRAGSCATGTRTVWTRSQPTRSARPLFLSRQSRTSRRSWPKNGSPRNAQVGTPQCPAASWSFWFCSITRSIRSTSRCGRRVELGEIEPGALRRAREVIALVPVLVPPRSPRPPRPRTSMPCPRSSREHAEPREAVDVGLLAPGPELAVRPSPARPDRAAAGAIGSPSISATRNRSRKK